MTDATPSKVVTTDDLEKEFARTVIGERSFITNTPRPSDKPNSRERMMDKLQPIEDLINERATTHGDYSLMSKVFRDLNNAWQWGPKELTPEEYTAMHMISIKMARIACGESSFREHWDDIAGYAKLVADRCSK